MRELDAIITKYEELKAQNIGCVLATVVHVEGSSYRRAGARMLVDEFGNITGAISGGCLCHCRPLYIKQLLYVIIIIEYVIRIEL